MDDCRLPCTVERVNKCSYLVTEFNEEKDAEAAKGQLMSSGGLLA